MQITLPDELTEQLQQLATLRHQPVEQLVMERLQQLLDVNWGQLPSAEQAELAVLSYLSDDALQAIADEQLPNQIQERIATLMEGNRNGKLTAEEHAELTTLVERGDQLMLRKAEAALLLKQRSSSPMTNTFFSSND